MIFENINPHDHFFKQTFADKRIASEFIQHYLPTSLADLFEAKKLEVINASYIDEDLKENLSDLLYRVPLKKGGEAFVYILLEHKSYSDKWVSMQLLRYLLKIWEDAKRKKTKKLPFVIPIVFYHGKSNWRVSKNFSALVDLDNDLDKFKHFLPEFEYHLFDLSKYLDEDLIGYAPLASALCLMRDIFRQDLKEKFPEAFKLLESGHLSEEEFNERIAVMGNYLLLSKKISEQDLRTSFDENFGEKGMVYMNSVVGKWYREGKNEGIVEGFLKGKNEGIAEGKLKGKLEGKLEGKIDIILTILRRKFSKLNDNSLNQIKNLSETELDNLSLTIFDLQDLNDLSNWLKKHSAK